MNDGSSPPWRRNVRVLTVAGFLTLASFAMVLPFLPVFLQEMGIRTHLETWAGLIYGASFLTGGLMAPVWGSLGDRYGRKAMVLRSGASIAAVNVLMAMATTPHQLLVLRGVNGLLGGFLPATNALVAATVPESHVGRALGSIQVGVAAGTITGPLIGGVLADAIGVRLTFYAASALMAVSTLLVYALVGESFERLPSAVGPRAAVRALPGETMAVLRRPGVVRVLLALLLLQAGTTGVQPVMALFVQRMDGQAAAAWTGLVLATAGLATVLATPVWGRLSDRLDLRGLLAWTTVAAGLTTLIQGLTTTTGSLLAARFAFGVAQSGTNQAANTLLARLVDGEARGRAYGLSSSAWMLGAVGGSVLGGAAAGWFGLTGAFWVSGLVLLAGAAWLLGWRFKVTRMRPSA